MSGRQQECLFPIIDDQNGENLRTFPGGSADGCLTKGTRYLTFVGMKVYTDTQDPRTKIWNAPETATFSEIVAVLLSHGNRHRNVKLLSHDVVKLAGDETGLFELDAATLSNIPGIGPSRAAVILAATELGRRRDNKALKKRQSYVPERVALALENLLRGKPVEFFYVFTYNRRMQLINSHPLNKGTADSVSVNYRHLLRILLNDHCTSFLLAHNHPESTARASRTDQLTVAQLDELLNPLGIELLDQFIVGEDGVFGCKRNSFILTRKRRGARGRAWNL